MLKRAAQFLRLKITPLIARLGLNLRRLRTIVLRARHFTGCQSRQQRGDNRQHDRRGAQNFTPVIVGQVILDRRRNGGFHDLTLGGQIPLGKVRDGARGDRTGTIRRGGGSTGLEMIRAFPPVRLVPRSVSPPSAIE